MSLYATGTITGALNATTITGTGTKWSDAKLGITNGSVLFISSNAGVDGVYQIKRVISDTSIELAQPIYKTFTNSKYSILVAESASTAAWSNQLAATLGYYQAQMDGWQQIMTGTGDIALTAPDGTKVTIKSFTALDNNKADKSPLGTAATKNTQTATNDGNTNNIMMVGGFGVGAQNPIALPQDISASNTNYPNGFYAALTQWVGSPAGISGQAVGVINLGMHQSASTTWRSQIATSYSSQGRMFFRVTSEGSWNTWRELWHSANTTVDSSGFIKQASPIINIYHDGTFGTNEESEGAQVVRESVGVYRVSHILGLNSDKAWGGVDGGFETPKDRNGQRLLWLDYEVDADGSILVKTYHRTYPDAPAFARNIKDGFEEGDPIDIPSDQFVSVRVEMPQDSVWNLAQKAAQEEMAQEEIAEE
ncbi:pyocin knob domain-containing protein [Obesumbacterium proteus]|uniref:pyocin knob domain-containing protein n=1 Tax=Obesumbacterium proteus TaxID=82983 RepID=UPI0007789CD0|nr:pyocin knob domain-containing protein [Obesumbacterium proteus]AMO82132.1 hypothetical protein DSM2777_14525 [Obesumbacterium proteus]